MSRIFVIPDIHLKPWIFCCAEERMKEERFDRAVVLGDLVDDWDQARRDYHIHEIVDE